MGLLDNFEQRLERVVNGAFSKTFRSGVQPLEITAALRHELDIKAAVVSRERILVPNEFRVLLSKADYDKMHAMGGALIDELVQLVKNHAAAQSYSFAGPVRVALEDSAELSVGIIRIESANVREEDVTWTPVIEIDGRQHRIKRGRTIVGRGSEADITVNDTGTSRKHVEILWDGERAQATDLGSTNGSKLDGEPLTKAVLQPGSVVQIGRTRIVFRVLPVSSASPRPGDPRREGDDGGSTR